MECLNPNHNDTMMVDIRIVNAHIKSVMIVISSSTNILYFDAFQKLGLTTNDLTP